MRKAPAGWGQVLLDNESRKLKCCKIVRFLRWLILLLIADADVKRFLRTGADAVAAANTLHAVGLL